VLIRRDFLGACAVSIGFAVNTTVLVPYAITQIADKTTRILVGFPPGGTSDVIARLLAAAMKDYSSSIIVENRPGSVGRIAIDDSKTSAADGSVILLTPLGTMTLSPHVYKNLRYDPFQDFIPVTTIGAEPILLTISSKVPANVETLADFISWCRANPEQSNYGSPGAGSPYHFVGAQLARAAGFKYMHVPYAGPPPVVRDLLGGQIASSILPIDGTLPYVLSGKVRALATTGHRRSPFLPSVPTISEAGFPELEAVDWWGVFLPAKASPEIVDKLNDSIQKALKTDEVRTGLSKFSIEVDTIELDGFARLMKTEFDRWGSAVRASGFTPED
jgi:tripartite-type tricarboxylate transporter receptor subunit TctC